MIRRKLGSYSQSRSSSLFTVFVRAAFVRLCVHPSGIGLRSIDLRRTSVSRHPVLVPVGLLALEPHGSPDFHFDHSMCDVHFLSGCGSLLYYIVQFEALVPVLVPSFPPFD